MNEKIPDDNTDEQPDENEISFAISEHHYPGSAVQCIAFNNRGGYYYSVGKQINLIESGNQVVSFSAASEVYSMAFNPKDTSLYFGTKESGLGRLYNNNITWFTVENSGLPRNLITKVICDAAGNVWFNSSANKLGGLMKYNGKTMEKFLPENSALPGNIVYDITAYGGDVFVSAEDPKGGFFIMKINDGNWSQVLQSKGCYIFQKVEVDREGRIYYTDDSREYCGGGLMPDYVVFSFNNGEKVVLREGNIGTEFTPYIFKKVINGIISGKLNSTRKVMKHSHSITEKNGSKRLPDFHMTISVVLKQMRRTIFGLALIMAFISLEGRNICSVSVPYQLSPRIWVTGPGIPKQT